MSSTKIYYIIPEDGDDEAHPNLFTVPLPQSQVKLRDIKAHFPLKQHRYHFRFKRPLQNKFIWLDMVDENSAPPTFEGLLFCKIARVGAADAHQEPISSFASATSKTASKPVVTTATKKVAETKPNTGNSLFEWTEMDESPAPSTSQPGAGTSATLNPVSKGASTNNDDLLGFLDSSQPIQAPAAPQQSVAGGLDFGWDADPFQSAPPVSSSSNTDFFGVPPASTSAPLPPRSVSPPSLNNNNVAKKTSQSNIPIELGAEAAKNFKL